MNIKRYCFESSDIEVNKAEKKLDPIRDEYVARKTCLLQGFPLFGVISLQNQELDKDVMLEQISMLIASETGED